MIIMRQLIVLAVIALVQSDSFHAKIKLPFLRSKEYTPLVFFTSRKGECSKCDAAEKQIKDVEKQLNVKVQRIKVGRNYAASAILRMLTGPLDDPPLFYNRESRQVIKCAPNKAPDKEGEFNIELNKKYMIDWALGRKLPQKGSYGTARSFKKRNNGSY